MENRYINKNGFSLIEIIVTIIILGALAVMAIPSYTAFVEQAAIQAAKNNLITISLAEKSYYLDHGAYFYSPKNQYDDLTEINTALSLNIQDNGFYFYSCAPVGGAAIAQYKLYNASILQITAVKQINLGAYWCRAFRQLPFSSTGILIIPDLSVSITGNINPFCHGIYCPS